MLTEMEKTLNLRAPNLIYVIQGAIDSHTF